MTEHCWYEITGIPMTIFKPEVSLTDVYDVRKISKLVDRNVLSDEMNDWGDSRGVKFSNFMTFWRPNIGCPAGPHVDLRSDGNFASPGINIELLGHGIMGFYRQKEGMPAPSIKHTLANTPYLEFRYDEIEKIDETDFVSGPRLVKTSIPHDLTVTVGPRLVVSLRTKIDGIIPNWEMLLEKFSGDIIPRK